MPGSLDRAVKVELLNRIIAKAVVFNDRGEVLLLRRSSTDTRRPLQWDLPGGAVDNGEAYTEAVVREIHEEAGLKVLVPQKNLIYTETMHAGVNIVFLIYMTSTNKTNVTLSNEHDKSGWYKPAEALAILEYELHKRVLQHVVAHNISPSV